MIPINAPQIGEEEIEAVIQVLKSGILTSGLGNGPNVVKFEKAFAEYVKSKHAIAVNSGTAALHAALLAIGVSKEDEVILPSFTFVATAEMVVLAGAKPIFVDINPETYTIDPSKIEEAITEKTKAVIPVDLYGLSADMKAIREIAEKHDLKIIEDAAQAHGALYRGEPPGKFADITCWSFYASKNMTTGEGGMITTDNDELAEKLRCLRSHGEREKYHSQMLGHNYRMPEIEAAIGYVQLKKLPNFLEKRRKNAEQLTKRLRECSELLLPNEPEGYRHSWYLYTVRLKNADAAKRNAFANQLRKRGIEVGIYYHTPIHMMDFYRQFGVCRLPETERAAQQVLSLPVHPGVSEEQVNFIVENVVQLLKGNC
ncbi:MAG TPA: DegT/DnrJ/EryC1/StrS family aminotransferase [Candidatus Bathyarchaeota archaeon]|nr:DegT/DnrJ/EryC1/StrS family aminotransferase [Candidatus Bathyarchaeota archaeon]